VSAARVRGEGAAAVALGGVAILLARPFVPAGPEDRVALFAAAYVAIGVASTVAGRSVEVAGSPAVSPWAALALGLAAVGAAAVAAGSPVPVPWGPSALPLGVLAAVAEEALFRRAAYGTLLRLGPAAAVLGSAALFALVHVPAYGVTALPVDLGAGLVLSWQRWASGTWRVPAATHAAANVLAVLR
jgi:membrane protease YdiL (CAAX protease family)